VNQVDVVGAGGIGCAVGYALCSAGVRVTFIDTDEEKLDWGRSHGVCVDQRPALSAEFITFESWAPSSRKPVLLCTKCYVNPTVLARFPSDGRLIPIQNGFDRSLDDRRPFLEGIASFVSECTPGQTHTRITRAGRLHLGVRKGDGAPNRSSALQKDLGELAAQLRTAPFQVQVVPDILPYKHTKLMYNAAIGPVAAAAGLDNGQLLAVPQARRWFFGLLQENYRILIAAGVALGKVGPFHPDTVHRILRHTSLTRMLSWAFYPTLRRTYCSMNADLLKGQTEIDCYNGYLIDLARNCPCPLNQRVYKMIKRMERDRIHPNVRMLDQMNDEQFRPLVDEVAP